MPGDAFGGLYGTFGRELPELVQNGTISQELLDDSVIRELTFQYDREQADRTDPSYRFRCLDSLLRCWS